mmetsp:Transcript_10834/g.35624  ORF Transcript_10834/g.35624 Transcript_10834/m.35624 type:complete len:86 (-) Transcript_10834:3640-3897(-)
MVVRPDQGGGERQNTTVHPRALSTDTKLNFAKATYGEGPTRRELPARLRVGAVQKAHGRVADWCQYCLDIQHKIDRGSVSSLSRT